MRKQVAAVVVLLVGVMSFVFVEAGRAMPALSPYFASKPLAGRVIGVDAGHGGYDGGAETKDGVMEKHINLDIAVKLKEELEAQGATVVMSRESDVALIDPKTTTGYKKRKELDERLRIFREENVDAMVSIHMNKYSDAGQRGAQVFYLEGAQDGRALSKAIQSALHEMDPEHTRTMSAGDYYVLNACDAAALVECGFLSNAQEARLLQSGDYQRKLAQVIAQGVVQYFDNAGVQ